MSEYMREQRDYNLARTSGRAETLSIKELALLDIYIIGEKDKHFIVKEEYNERTGTTRVIYYDTQWKKKTYAEIIYDKKYFPSIKIAQIAVSLKIAKGEI